MTKQIWRWLKCKNPKCESVNLLQYYGVYEGQIEGGDEFTTADNAWVFPSERMTPLGKENVWQRSIGPRLKKAGLGWVNFQVMRRTHASLMNDLGKLVADQLGHSLDVNQNVYTQSAVSKRQITVNQLEVSLNGVQTEFTALESISVDSKL